MRVVNIITLLLVIVGGLNWGLVGLFDFDLVTAILGNGSAETATSSGAARVVYILVAVRALSDQPSSGAFYNRSDCSVPLRRRTRQITKAAEPQRRHVESAEFG